MTLRERLNKLPEKLHFGNEPTDEFIDGLIETARAVFQCVLEDTVENEPQARNTISDINGAIEVLPCDCSDVADIDSYREEIEK